MGVLLVHEIGISIGQESKGAISELPNVMAFNESKTLGNPIESALEDPNRVAAATLILVAKVPGKEIIIRGMYI